MKEGVDETHMGLVCYHRPGNDFVFGVIDWPASLDVSPFLRPADNSQRGVFYFFVRTRS
jgi:hypothetical protein